MRVLFVFLLTVLVAGCKIQIIAPPHVAVVSGDFTMLCLPGETCEVEVTDYEFHMDFYAVPRPGYSFLYWKNAPHHLCPGFFSNRCTISTVGVDPTDDAFRALLASDVIGYLEPVYRRDEETPAIDWRLIEGGGG